MNGRLLAALTLSGCLLPAPVPASAIGHSRNGDAQWKVEDDAAFCYVVDGGTAAFTGTATATGVVTTYRPTVKVQVSSMSSLREVMADAESFTRTAGGEVDGCVGGVGKPVLSGWAMYTLSVHSVQFDVVEVLNCVWEFARRTCR